jgi:UDP-glucose 4-epimerase
MRILITGGSGFIGRNLKEQLAPTYEVLAPSSAELDLVQELLVRDYLHAHRPDVILHAAVGRANRRLGASPKLLDRNCRMFFNLTRHRGLFGKLIHFGSGAQYGPRASLPKRVCEDYFDTRVPTDPYGFSKYICARYIERSSGIVDLRLFGVFGPYEDYTVRFISNACCRALKGLPIVLRQDVVFDYLYVNDLVRITRWFIENNSGHRAYNVCSGRQVALRELASIVAEVSGRNPTISVGMTGMGSEYTADNSRLLTEIGAYKFWDIESAIGELYEWYRANPDLFDSATLQFDTARCS